MALRRVLLVVVAAQTVAATAYAQTLPSFDARTWRPSTDPGAGLVVEPVATPGAGNWNVGALFDYTHHPLTLRDAGTDNVAFRPVEALVGMDLVASVGIGARAALGLSLPTALYQEGSTGLPPTIHATGGVPTTAIGDLGIHGKATLVKDEAGGFGLAALGTVTLPTGDKASFLGEGSTTVEARLLAEYTLVIASAQASLGYRLRTDNPVWPDASVGGVKFGDVMPWTFGVTLKPAIFKLDGENRQRWDLAVHGWLPMTPVGPFGAGEPGSARETPMLLDVSDRIALGHSRDVYALLGVDIGLTDAIGVPAFRAVAGLGWAPREHDQDHDGVPDDVDQCPDLPEDKDGFEDSDGCPDVDNDDDGILDKEDACPNVPGVESPDPKKNGCPAVDQDGDGIADDVDACPTEKGEHSDDPKKNGCPVRDRDGDGIPDDADKCPDQPEDKDGFEDTDGCPDPDNDGDGIEDKLDACPNVKGEATGDPATNGCPVLDHDGDTFDDAADKCPNEPEVFNGVKDDDGCPDTGGRPLVVIDPKDPKLAVRLAAPLKFAGTAEAPTVDAASVPELRALALELHKHPEWSIVVGARPAAAPKGTPADKLDAQKESAQAAALARAQAVAKVLDALAHKDSLAEAAAWDAVKDQPGSESGIGMRVTVAAPKAQSAPPLPSAPSAPTSAPPRAPKP